MELNKLYNMCCMEGMKQFPDNYFDLALVDPPFFSGPEKEGFYNGGQAKKGIGYKKHKYKTIETWAVPDYNYYNELTRVSKQQIIWGINYFPFAGEISGRIIWDKKNDASTFSKCEIASISIIKTVQIFRYRWSGFLQENMKNKEYRIHPTQKPIQLYKWLLRNYAKPTDKIIDTHVGSGSSIIAFNDFGCEWIGFEIDKDYFEAASKRIAQHKSQQRLNLK